MGKLPTVSPLVRTCAQTMTCSSACAGGGVARVAAASAIVGAGVAVMGHVGLMPQAISVLGGFRPHGQTASEAVRVLREAKARMHPHHSSASPCSCPQTGRARLQQRRKLLVGLLATSSSLCIATCLADARAALHAGSAGCGVLCDGAGVRAARCCGSRDQGAVNSHHWDWRRPALQRPGMSRLPHGQQPSWEVLSLLSKTLRRQGHTCLCARSLRLICGHCFASLREK